MINTVEKANNCEGPIKMGCKSAKTNERWSTGGLYLKYLKWPNQNSKDPGIPWACNPSHTNLKSWGSALLIGILKTILRLRFCVCLRMIMSHWLGISHETSKKSAFKLSLFFCFASPSQIRTSHYNNGGFKQRTGCNWPSKSRVEVAMLGVFPTDCMLEFSQQQKTYPSWLVVSNMFMFHFIYAIIIPTDFHSIIFQRGLGLNHHQPAP